MTCVSTWHGFRPKVTLGGWQDIKMQLLTNRYNRRGWLGIKYHESTKHACVKSVQAKKKTTDC